MQLVNAWKHVVTENYVNFAGRANRAEFWWFVLANLIVIIVVGNILSNLPGALGTLFSFVTLVYVLGVLLPSLGVAIRRLHDIGRSGWWYLIGLVPIVGFILLLVWYVKAGDPTANEYGEPSTWSAD